MEKEDKELQSRRDFFKKTAKRVLPLLGVLTFGPSILSSCSKEDDEYDISGDGSSSGGCSGCDSHCMNECKGTASYTSPPKVVTAIVMPLVMKDASLHV